MIHVQHTQNETPFVLLPWNSRHYVSRDGTACDINP